MKINLLNTLAIAITAIFLSACGEAETSETTTETPSEQLEENENENEESSDEQETSNTVSDEQMAHYEELLKLTSTETTGSDCFIKESFVYNDAHFITVDFVNYRLVEGTGGTDHEEYELVNVIKTLRTFAVNEEYFNCGRDKKVKLSDLLAKNKAKKNLVFSLEVVDGVVSELYIDTCSG